MRRFPRLDGPHSRNSRLICLSRESARDPRGLFFGALWTRYIFSSESVGEGHPDKVADTISDAVLDACLAQDKFSRVACETYVKSNTVIIGGEITTKAKLDFVKIARESHPRDRLRQRR